MPFEIKRATRRALPIQAAFIGPQNSGKTWGALMFAAGLVPGKDICVIETERGRTQMYSDDPDLLKVMPQGFDVIEVGKPYHPQRIIEAMDALESSGKYSLGLLDSASDPWDGPGGCTDIAEGLKNMWAVPKLWNKRLLNRMVLSDIHWLVTIKAHDKTKIIDKKESASGKTEYISLGVQPVCEKNFFHPFLLAFEFEPETHLAKVRKYHKGFYDLYKTPHLITPTDGELLRKWNEGAQALADPHEQLRARAHSAAEDGVEAYRRFWAMITAQQRVILKTDHEANKALARKVGALSIPTFGSAEEPVEWPDSFDGPECIWNGKHLVRNDNTGNYEHKEAVA
jgi:hypothetical protein